MSARDIGEHTFEIILTMEGITPETGNTVQVGTTQIWESYKGTQIVSKYVGF